MKNILIACTVALFISASASAQDRYIIYPVPHQQTLDSGLTGFSGTVNIVAGPQIDAATLNRAGKVLEAAGLNAVSADKISKSASNVILGVAGSGDQADRLAKKYRLDRSVFSLEKYDRHILCLRGNAPSDIDFENNPDFQLEILNGMGEDISLSKVTAEPAAEVLMPFIKWLRENR